MVTFDEKSRFALQRATMVRNDLLGRDITAPAVVEVMASLPREEFLTGPYIDQAYCDQPLPIGMGQTISQPYIVALMTQHLGLNRDCRVLEIGTGSGYQTAILAKLAAKVFTIERFGQLAESAQAVLARLNIRNVEYFIGDGSCGWPRPGQFDAIIITAAVPAVPQSVIEQLAENGRLVAPVGGEYQQDLVKMEKLQGKVGSKILCQCRFVKLVGKYGFTQTE